MDTGVTAHLATLSHIIAAPLDWLGAGLNAGLGAGLETLDLSGAGVMAGDARLTIAMVITLAVIAFIAGLIDAIAGGGGLLVLPALLLAGFNPASALATNKLQAAFGSGSATFSFTRAGLIDWRATAPMFVLAAGGAMLGAGLVTTLPTDWLRLIMPVMLIGIAVYMGFARKLGDSGRPPRVSILAFTCTIPPLIGFYDGVFGPGTGSLLMLAFVSLLGFGAVHATGRAKALNFASNAGALAILAATQPVAWIPGLLMGLCAWAGARIGAAMAIRNGARLIRPLLVIACCVMAGRLLLAPAQEWLSMARDILQF